MKILYVGDLSSGATSKMRMMHLQRLGHFINAIDTTAAPKAGYALNNISRVAWRLGWPLDLSKMSDQVIKSVKLFHPDLVWIDKGIMITRTVLMELKTLVPDVPLVHYNPDDPFGPFGRAGWRRFIDAIPAYDVHFVARRENVEEYKSRGGKRVIQNIPTRGFDPEIHRPYGDENELKVNFAADVGFLGTYEKDRAGSLMRLAEAGFQVRLMEDWPQKCWHDNFLRAPFQVRGAEYAKTINSFKIGLGFLRKANRDQHTSRSIEIPACGTFLLAERTEEHLILFDEGKEAEFFSTDEELIDKVRFYLAHDAARENIAREGRERCLRAGYDYTSRMRQMLGQVLETGV